LRLLELLLGLVLHLLLLHVIDWLLDVLLLEFFLFLILILILHDGDLVILFFGILLFNNILSISVKIRIQRLVILGLVRLLQEVFIDLLLLLLLLLILVQLLDVLVFWFFAWRCLVHAVFFDSVVGILKLLLLLLEHVFVVHLIIF